MEGPLSPIWKALATPHAGAFLLPQVAVRGLRPMLERRIKIRWRDMDAYGHVNNAVYLTYLEEARDAWAKEMLGTAFDFVIVRIAIDFRNELSLLDEEITIRCWGAGVGRSSIRTREEIAKLDGSLASESESVIVAHDPVTRAATPLSDEQRELVNAAIAADARLNVGERSADPT